MEEHHKCVTVNDSAVMPNGLNTGYQAKPFTWETPSSFLGVVISA